MSAISGLWLSAAAFSFLSISIVDRVRNGQCFLACLFRIYLDDYEDWLYYYALYTPVLLLSGIMAKQWNWFNEFVSSYLMHLVIRAWRFCTLV